MEELRLARPVLNVLGADVRVRPEGRVRAKHHAEVRTPPPTPHLHIREQLVLRYLHHHHAAQHKTSAP